MIASIVSQFAPYLAVVAALIAAFFVGHSKGKAKAEVKAEQDKATVQVAEVKAATDAQLIARKDAQNAQDEASNLDSGTLADRLQQYTRPESPDNR